MYDTYLPIVGRYLPYVSQDILTQDTSYLPNVLTKDTSYHRYLPKILIRYLHQIGVNRVKAGLNVLCPAQKSYRNALTTGTGTKKTFPTGTGTKKTLPRGSKRVMPPSTLHLWIGSLKISMRWILSSRVTVTRETLILAIIFDLLTHNF